MEWITLTNSNPLSLSKKQGVFIRSLIELLVSTLSQENPRVISPLYLRQLLGHASSLLTVSSPVFAINRALLTI